MESRREEEGLRCEREGLFRGGGWVGDTPPPLARPNLRHIHFTHLTGEEMDSEEWKNIQIYIHAWRLSQDFTPDLEDSTECGRTEQGNRIWESQLS